jgi:phosphatidylglycerol:prolipoprotein diacylglycerol transferase
MRKMTRVLSFVPPVVAYLLLRPANFAEQTLVQLSTSQWVALLTAIPAAVTYGVYFKAAEAHPEDAMELRLDAFYEAHPEQKPGAKPVAVAEPAMGSAGDEAHPKDQAATSIDSPASLETTADQTSEPGAPSVGKA